MPKNQFTQDNEHYEMGQSQMDEWNATRQDYALDADVTRLVALQASIRPEAEALVLGDQVLNYRDLNRRANQLAHYLQALGVGPNVLVSLCVDRSLDMAVGLLGILKSGGAYVPLDPTYPADRLAFMMEDARTPVLVTQEHLLSHLSAHQGRTICLDTDAALLTQQSEAEPACAATLADLAYVIYTSGSTGRPKGVQIARKSLLNLVFWHQQAFTVTHADRATQLTSPAFDATGWELWPYLTAGASVYLLDGDTRVMPELCRDWLLSHGITITFLPTALVEGVLALDWPPTSTLRFLLTGADRLQNYPSPRLPFALINNYGPTEATVVATSGQIFPTEHPDGPPSIGRPIANTQIYILDESMQQVAIGMSGEMYIGGAGLAMGYLNRPELTAERFVSHPFSADPEARLYKTGDLVRYLPDGQIAFIGRADYQIKIRGYRIEPGEIASVLNEHPAIQTSLVIAREDTPGEKRLVAYLVQIPGAHITASSLREALGARLPDYMIPAAFILLESIPATPNGKVDRAALPTPDAINTLRDAAIAEPDTTTEKRLVGIVTTLLGLEQIGIDDNFFMLGGHSMLGTQLIVQISKVFGVDLSLLALFQAPTVRQLSAEVEQRIIARIEAMSEEEVLRLLAEEQNVI